MFSRFVFGAGMAALVVSGVCTDLAAVDKRASNYWVRLQAAATMIQPTGEVGYGGGNVDLKDLSLDDDVWAPVLNATAQLPLLIDARVGYVSTELEGTAALGYDWSFGGVNLPAGTDLKTTVTLSDSHAELAFRLPIPTEIASAAIGLGIHYIDLELKQEPAGGSAITVDGAIPVPTLGLYASVNPIPLIGLEASAQGMESSAGDGKAEILDIRGQVVIRPWNKFGAVVGYRYATYNIRLDDNTVGNAEADLDLSGFYAGLLAQF